MIIGKATSDGDRSKCALFRFYVTLIYRNTIKSKQDPCAV